MYIVGLLVRQFQIQIHTTGLVKYRLTLCHQCLANPSEDCSVTPVMLNGFPFFPLNVPALKPDLLRENSCVAYSIFSILRWERKTTKREEATTVSGDVAQKGSGHASQSPSAFWELMLGVTAWSAQP